MGYITFLKKASVQAKHRREEWLTRVVQLLKHCVLFRNKAKQLFAWGKDAAERMKKDTKLAVTFAAAGFLCSLQQSLEELKKILAENEATALLERAARDDLDVEDKIISFLPVLVEALEQVVMHESTVNVQDCMESKACDLKTSLELAMNKLRTVSHGHYEGGPQDWKQTIPDESSVDVVLTKASETISKLKSSEFQPEIKSADKACPFLGSLLQSFSLNVP